MLSEKQPLCAEARTEEDEDVFSQEFSTVHDVTLWRRRFFLLLMISILAVSSLVFILGGAALRATRPLTMDGVTQPYCKRPYRYKKVLTHILYLAPAQDVVRYVNKYLVHDPESARFMGKPRPELDEAWNELLEGGISLRIPVKSKYES